MTAQEQERALQGREEEPVPAVSSECQCSVDALRQLAAGFVCPSCGRHWWIGREAIA